MERIRNNVSYRARCKMVDRSDDLAFLADLTGFLDAYEPSVELDQQDITSHHLLLDNDQLLAETEALLRHSSDAIEPVHRNAAPLPEQLKESRNAQAAKRRLKYQEKLKNERYTLEEEEINLSDELEELQRARKRAKTLGDIRTPSSMWRAIAIRQKEGRVVAEEQQRRLQNVVDNRAKVIEEIGQMMRERVCGSKSSVDIKMAKENSVQLNADDTALFEEFLHDLDVVYARTEDVFRSCGAEENPVASYRLGPERKRDGDFEYIDNLDVFLTPFSFKETCASMWQSMIRVYRQKDRHHYDGIADPENTVAVKLHMQTSRESGETVDMLVNLVMRRYLEDERMVVVWRALSEGEGKFTGIHSDETGWGVIRPNYLDELLLRTVMQTFVRFIPMDTTDTTDDTVDGYQFTKLVVTSTEEDGAEVARMMDSLLLEDSLD